MDLDKLNAKDAIKLLRALIENCPEAIALVDADGSILGVNSAAEKFWKRPATELKSLTWPEITHPDDIAKDKELVLKVLSGEINGYELVKRYKDRDGKYIWAVLHVAGTGVDLIPLVATIQSGDRQKAKHAMLRDLGYDRNEITQALSELKEAIANARSQD